MYTQKEHFVSRFILNNFINESGLLCFINKKHFSGVKLSNPNSVMYEKNLYEFKNRNGDYFLRNYFEKKFADVEGYISHEINNLKIDKIIKRGMSSKLKRAFILLISLHKVKNPSNKAIVDEFFDFSFMGDEDSKIMKNYVYMSLISNKDFALKYLRDNGLLLTNKQLRFFGPHYLFKNTLKELMLYNVVLLVADEKIDFLIGDRPIIRKMYGDDYIFPFHPKMAIYLYLLENEDNKFILNMLNGDISYIDYQIVDSINRATYKNSENIVVSTTENAEYLNRILNEDK